MSNFNPSFTCAILPPNGSKNRLWSFAERYLNISGERYQASTHEGRTFSLRPAENSKQQWWVRSLKIASYCSVIFPLVALVHRSICRSLHTFSPLPAAAPADYSSGTLEGQNQTNHQPTDIPAPIALQETPSILSPHFSDCSHPFSPITQLSPSGLASPRSGTSTATTPPGVPIGYLTHQQVARLASEKLHELEPEKVSPESNPSTESTPNESSKPVLSLPSHEFFAWIKQNPDRIESKEPAKRVVSIIKNAEVDEEELREFYAGLSESLVLQLLFYTQTQNSFNAIDEQIIEKALILETNFIQALNKKCPHRNPALRAKIEQRPLGPSIFRHSMEEAEIKQIGTAFFEDLKKSGQLLTNEQFAAQAHKGLYKGKGRELGRILGANYIKKVAEELGLKHIKVPQKIAVVDEKTDVLRVHVLQASLELSCKQVTIYAEDITPLERETTREEMEDFLKIVEATGFGDFSGLNFFVGKNHQGEEGIYFTETQYTNFRHNPFLEPSIVSAIGGMVQESGLDWFKLPDGFARYRHHNQQRIGRYLKLYGIRAPSPEALLKTYVPEADRRKVDVTITYAL